jgi:transcriptional regulator with XRE-family HTH domain
VRVADKVLTLRKERGWSQLVLAKKAHVTQTTISGIESDRHVPRLNHVFQIARAFDMTIAEFLHDVDDFERRERRTMSSEKRTGQKMTS